MKRNGDPIFTNYGGRVWRKQSTRRFEDNSVVKSLVDEPAKVTVDGGVTSRRALGDMLAEKAAKMDGRNNRYGCIRDVDVIMETELRSRHRLHTRAKTDARHR